jgi:transcription elongation factor GreA
MTRPGAADLLRAVGLLADGPVRWGQPAAGRGPGLYVVELATPEPTPAIDVNVVGRWLERVPGLLLDGTRPTSKALLARLASLWLPDATVLYVAATSTSIGGRVSALNHHVLGDPRPHADGQWLHLLRNLPTTRLWWASTDAPEEYLDAVLEAFASAAAAPTSLPSGLERPRGALLLPWATTRRPTGERQAHGITGATLPLPEEAPTPPKRIIQLPPGDAEGAGVSDARPTVARPATARPASAAAGSSAAARTRAASSPAPRPTVTATSRSPKPPSRADTSAPVELSPEAHARMLQELDELTRLRRPEVVARIKSARELGDLKENSEYHAAREEQSFLEGRVQLLEQRLRHAIVIDDASRAAEMAAGGRRGATIGSKVTIELNGEESTYTLVGSTEANAAAGRISTSSPVGSALLGSAAGQEVAVRTPRGEVRYRVVSVE